jgi:hypothetical protein
MFPHQTPQCTSSPLALILKFFLSLQVRSPSVFLSDFPTKFLRAFLTYHTSVTCLCCVIWVPYHFMRSALLWDITHRRVVILYRRFGTTYRSYLFCSWTILPLKMGPRRCTETSVKDYHSTLCNILEERRSLQIRGGSLKSFYHSSWAPTRFISDENTREMWIQHMRKTERTKESGTNLTAVNFTNYKIRFKRTSYISANSLFLVKHVRYFLLQMTNNNTAAICHAPFHVYWHCIHLTCWDKPSLRKGKTKDILCRQPFLSVHIFVV